jgi:cell division protein FtsI (penicillin-binding protein 3)
MTIKKEISIRVYILFVFLLLFAVMVMAKTFVTQQVEGKYWKNLADSLTTDYKMIEADRGNIYSADGRLLSTSLPFFEIRMDTKAEHVTNEIFNTYIDSLANCLSLLFMDKSAFEYKDFLKTGRKNSERYLLLKRKVSYTDLIKLRKFPIFNLGKYKGGLISIQQSRRVNPYRMLAFRTIGCYRENAQLIGLEAAYDTVLKGTNGRMLMQKIAGNTWIPIENDNGYEPINGKDILTTIDVGLQDVAEKALLNTLVKNEADHGCVVLMEVKTGKIKAIANLGKAADGTYGENYNYAIAEAIEPGSTFKMASCAALIESGLVDSASKVDLEHGLKIYGKQQMKDHELTENYVSLKRAFEISSNVGISKMVYNCFVSKPTAYIDLLYRFGLNKKTGIDLQGEAAPDVKNIQSKRWNKVVSLPWMAVGYETRVTPLQTLTFYNAIANNGKRMQPYIVEEIREFGKVVKRNSPTQLGAAIVSQRTVDQLKGLMEGVVENGTARKVLKNNNYTIGGKTGTAQIFQIGSGFNNKGGGNKKFLASFVGYFPANNPLYSCIVVIYNPTKDKGVYYGSQVACPVFKELADKIYATSTEIHAPVYIVDSAKYDKPAVLSGNRYDLEKVLKNTSIAYNTTESNIWVSSQHEANKYNFIANPIKNAIMPNLINMSAKDAVYILENNGIKVSLKGVGKVAMQSLPAGDILVKGSMVQLELK